MDILIFERRHASGVIARVHRDSEGAGYRPSSFPAREDTGEPEWPYFDTIDEALAAADAAAHPGCTGAGCEPWGARSYRPVE